MSSILSIGTAVPPFSIDQKTAASLVTEHYGDILRPRSLEVMRKVLEHPSIKKRYISVDNLAELITFKHEDPDTRIKRFTKWGTKLGTDAALQAMEKAGVSAEDISVLVVNTCTGYICPGLSSYIMESLNLKKDIKAFDLVGLGCGGAVPNIDMARSVLATCGGGKALSISVEICSATYQMDDDISLIISNAIFGDGAAAACISDTDEGLQIMASQNFLNPDHRDDVRYNYKKGQLHNHLSQKLPDIVGTFVPHEIQQLLSTEHLSTADIAHWAIHPGGHKMLEQIKSIVSLPEPSMQWSRNALANYGNMSSPTVLFALQEIMDNPLKKDDWVFMVGYGAGLSIYSLLLKN